MTCANPACGAEALYLRSGGIDAVDCLGDPANAGQCQTAQPRVIPLGVACTGKLAVETWRPPGEQLRPSMNPHARFPRARGQNPAAESRS
jgi:hypothetical protein